MSAPPANLTCPRCGATYTSRDIWACPDCRRKEINEMRDEAIWERSLLNLWHEALRQGRTEETYDDWKVLHGFAR